LTTLARNLLQQVHFIYLFIYLFYLLLVNSDFRRFGLVFRNKIKRQTNCFYLYIFTPPTSQAAMAQQEQEQERRSTLCQYVLAPLWFAGVLACPPPPPTAHLVAADCWHATGTSSTSSMEAI
jgi:hypothetical protein